MTTELQTPGSDERHRNFKKVQKLVKEGKISDRAASLHAALGTAPKPVVGEGELKEILVGLVYGLTGRVEEYRLNSPPVEIDSIDDALELIEAYTTARTDEIVEGNGTYTYADVKKAVYDVFKEKIDPEMIRVILEDIRGQLTKKETTDEK